MRTLLRLPALLRCRRAAAAIEFGLVAPVIIMVLLAVADIGGSIQQTIRLEASARTALGYAHLHNSPDQMATIRSLIVTALNDSSVTVGNIAMTCDCVTSTGAAGSAGSGTCGVDYACSSGQEMRRFLTVNVSRPYSGIVFMQGRTLQGNIVLRVE